MCGILFELRPGGHPPGAAVEVPDWMSRRGPDAQGSLVVRREAAAGAPGETLVFAGSVLRLRGGAADAEGDGERAVPMRACVPGAPGGRRSVLLFNGEIYDGLEVPEGASDAAALLRALVGAAARGGAPAAVPELVSRLRGPWSLVFYDVRRASTHPAGRRGTDQGDPRRRG